MATCTHCDTPLPVGMRGYYARRGFCSGACSRAYVPTLRSVLCANETCKRDDGARKVFTTWQRTASCCCQACTNTHWQRQRDWRKATRPVLPRPRSSRPVEHVDLPAAEIERRLEALAAKRRATRSWLRIEDPWAQRPGSALHHSAVVTHSVDMDGSYQ